MLIQTNPFAPPLLAATLRTRVPGRVRGSEVIRIMAAVKEPLGSNIGISKVRRQRLSGATNQRSITRFTLLW
ncbi:unnamed protein product [Boreogadus saida]